MKFRKHVRLKEYDYSSPNWYFVTICTKNRAKMFLPSVAAASYAAKYTKVLRQCLQDLHEKYYDNLEIDFYCIMPDHLHVIFAFVDCVRRKSAIGSRNYSLGDIVRVLKATVTRDIGKPIFQPNYYEHIIRSESSLERIRKYILNNPQVEYGQIAWDKLDPMLL